MGNTARTTVKFLIVCFIVWRSNWIFFRFDLTIAYRLRENVLQTHFDSNAISPGTQFMVSLETVLMEYLSNKIKHQTSWQSCEIYVSGSNVCAIFFFTYHNQTFRLIYIHLLKLFPIELIFAK